MSTTQKTWLSRAEAADYLGVSQDVIDRLRATGHLRTYRATGTSRVVRLNVKELDNLMMPDNTCDVRYRAS